MKDNIGPIDFNRLDYNLVVTFLAIWEERSVSKAAFRLSLSQSSVSAALARLRLAVGDPLFLRTKGGMQPTPRAITMAGDLEAGAALLRRAFRHGTGFDAEHSTRHFSLGMSDDFELAFGPALAQRLLSEAPFISVVFRQTNRQTVEAMLEARQIELAIVARPPARSWLGRDGLGASRYACLLDANLCEVSLPLTLKDYVTLPHILVSFSGREGIVDKALRAIGRTRHIHTALTHFSTLPAFLSRMPAVTTLPAHAATVLTERTGLVSCDVPMEMPTFEVSLVWRRDADGDEGLAWLRSMVRKVNPLVATVRIRI